MSWLERWNVACFKRRSTPHVLRVWGPHRVFEGFPFTRFVVGPTQEVANEQPINILSLKQPTDIGCDVNNSISFTTEKGSFYGTFEAALRPRVPIKCYDRSWERAYGLVFFIVVQHSNVIHWHWIFWIKSRKWGNHFWQGAVCVAL